MAEVWINGQKIEVPGDGPINIQSRGSTIRIGGSVVASSIGGDGIISIGGSTEVDLKIVGAVANIDAGGSVDCGDVSGDVEAGNSVRCGSVKGSVDGGNSVTVTGNVGGDVDAGNSVTVTGNVDGDIDAGGKVTVGSRSRS